MDPKPPEMPKIEVEDVDGPDSLDDLDPSSSDDHLRTLKALAEKLRLETRRPSYQEWRAQVEAQSSGRGGITDAEAKPQGSGQGSSSTSSRGGPPAAGGPQGGSTQSREVSGDSGPASGTLKGFGNIDEALVWLRKELVRYCRSKSLNAPKLETIKHHFQRGVFFFHFY